MDVTFRESIPFYGERSDLSDLFVALGSPNLDEVTQEGEEKKVQSDSVEKQLNIEGVTSSSTMEAVNDESSSPKKGSGSEGLCDKDFSKVYTRRKYRTPTEVEEVAPVSPMHESELEAVDVTSVPEIEIDSTTPDDLPIALRKGTRTSVGVPPQRYGFEHDIGNYVSYTSLSPAYKAFLASLQSVIIPRDWKEAKQNPKWKEAMLEELKALEKNKTWNLVHVPMDKKVVGCKWVYTVVRSK
jgi:hypothetical protein